jgi:hypothetical protein
MSSSVAQLKFMLNQSFPSREVGLRYRPLIGSLEPMGLASAPLP